MQRVYKTTARKLFDAGEDVQLYPCKANVNSPWVRPVTINKRQGENFDKIISEFAYYNCNHEMGYYPSYYICKKLDGQNKERIDEQ